jgi:hypothetical protein
VEWNLLVLGEKMKKLVCFGIWFLKVLATQFCLTLKRLASQSRWNIHMGIAIASHPSSFVHEWTTYGAGEEGEFKT